MSGTDPSSPVSSPAGVSGTSSGPTGSTPIASTALRALALAVVATAGATAVKNFRAVVAGALVPLASYVIQVAAGDAKRFKGVSTVR